MPVTACEFESHPAHIVRFTSKGIPKRNALFFVLSASRLKLQKILCGESDSENFYVLFISFYFDRNFATDECFFGSI